MSSKTINRALLVVVLLELLLGGNGYLTEVGGIRLRVLLFLCCMMSVACHFTLRPRTSLPKEVWLLTALFIGISCIGILIGLGNGNRVDFILAELKALMYFPMLLFFALVIKDSRDIRLVANLIVFCGVLQAILYLCVMTLAHTGLVSYSSIYEFLSQSDEFIFRHNPADGFFAGFFYKGAFHLAIAAIFLLLDPVRKHLVLASMVVLALAFTMTRGLLAALMLSLIAAVFLIRKRLWIYGLLVGLALSVIALVSTDLLQFFQRPESDEVRLNDILLIAQEVDFSMAIVGEGIGALIGERNRIEVTYLEIFYKQGMLGLFFWAAVLSVNLAAFLRLTKRARRVALPFLLSTLFVYFATATNTFLTGSIGMCIVQLSTVALLIMSRRPHDAGVKPHPASTGGIQ
jgi:O-antigen ligase